MINKKINFPSPAWLFYFAFCRPESNFCSKSFQHFRTGTEGETHPQNSTNVEFHRLIFFLCLCVFFPHFLACLGNFTSFGLWFLSRWGFPTLLSSGFFSPSQGDCVAHRPQEFLLLVTPVGGPGGGTRAGSPVVWEPRHHGT